MHLFGLVRGKFFKEAVLRTAHGFSMLEKLLGKV
jgi:hypothetical protein